MRAPSGQMRRGRSWAGKVAGTVLAMVLAGTGERASAAGARSLGVQGDVLAVNGLTATTGLSLRIANLHYLYVAVPGSGTAVEAEEPFSGAREQSGFQGSTLSVTAGGSRLQLTAANRMRRTRSVYVRFERGTDASVHFPATSYRSSPLALAIAPEERMALGVRGVGRGPARVKGWREVRTAELCTPSASGPERCATIREVIYKP